MGVPFDKLRANGYLRPFVVSLSNHGSALRQAQGERDSESHLEYFKNKISTKPSQLLRKQLYNL